MSEQLLRKNDVARLLNVSLRTVDRLLASGTLPAVKVGSRVRVRPESIELFLNHQQKGISNE